jgi:hypothetical protein
MIHSIELTYTFIILRNYYVPPCVIKSNNVSNLDQKSLENSKELCITYS